MVSPSPPDVASAAANFESTKHVSRLGHDFFYAVSEILQDAKETIFILGWWISPELHLRRPFKQNEEFRLDRLLLKKAQEGVKIMIIVCKKQSPRMATAH